MNLRNTSIVLLVALATGVSLFYGGYLLLRPLVFVLGLVMATGVSLYASQKLASRELLVLFLVSMGASFIDEWVHTSSGVFAYYDQLKPSPLTVFGWPLFILSILSIAWFVSRKVSLYFSGNWGFRGLPVIAATIAIVLLAWGQGYLDVFLWAMVILYLAHIVAGLQYSSGVPISWGLSVMTTSMLLGGMMEYIGSVEGTWKYRSGEHLVYFMVFTWALRTLTVLMISKMLGVDVQVKCIY